MIVAQPGGLQEALDDGAQNDELVRCRNGADFSPDGVTVPAGVTLDARPASFDTPGGGIMMRFESGAVMLGGYVDAQGFDGTVFAIEADAGETISGPTGPFETFASTGTNGETGGCTGLLLRADDGGTIDEVRSHVRTFRMNVALEVVADGSGSVTNCDVYTMGGQNYKFIYQHGDGEQAYNTWFGHNQPEGGVAPSQWHVDAPNAHDEWCEAYLWDPHRMARPWAIHVEQASGNIVYANAKDRERTQDNRFFKFVDESDSEGNRALSLNDLSDGQRDDLGFPPERFETARFYDAVGVLGGDGEIAPEPTPEPEPDYDNELVVQGTGSLTNYEFEVTGALEAGAEADIGGNGNGADTIDGSIASGAVDNRGTDDYYFDGKVVSFARNGDLDLFVDGEAVDPDGFGSSEPARSLSIVGTGPRVEYELSVSGELEKSTARDGSINSSDEIDGSTATGYVLGGTDSYRF
ncbi:hypothetical protein BRC68_05000, partial [Halobacteriales archaeon QH_6_64_20]